LFQFALTSLSAHPAGITKRGRSRAGAQTQSRPQ
jgi:hypothetical protein